MKEIKKEIVNYSTSYVAVDGTEFNDKEECQKYEKSARCALFARYATKVIDRNTEFSFFGFGSDDCRIECVRPESEDEVDLIMQIYFLENPHMEKDEYGHKEIVAEMRKRLMKAAEEKDIVFIGRGYGDDSFYLEGTRNEHIAALNRVGQPKKEEEA